MEEVEVPPAAASVGRTLEELKLVERFGRQICGVQREEKIIQVPTSQESLNTGDRLLVLGSHDRIKSFRAELRRPQAQSAARE